MKTKGLTFREGAGICPPHFSPVCPLFPVTLSRHSSPPPSPCPHASPCFPWASTYLMAPAHHCAPDPGNHAGHLHAAEPHPGASGPRGGPAAHLSPGQLVYDRGRRGPAHVPPPTGQVPSKGGLSATTSQRVKAALPPPHPHGLGLFLPRGAPCPSRRPSSVICGAMTTSKHSQALLAACAQH